MRNKLLEAIKPLQLNTNDKNKLVNTIIDIGNSGGGGGGDVEYEYYKVVLLQREDPIGRMFENLITNIYEAYGLHIAEHRTTDVKKWIEMTWIDFINGFGGYAISDGYIKVVKHKPFIMYGMQGDSSYTFRYDNEIHVEGSLIDAFITVASGGQAISEEELIGIKQMIENVITPVTKEEYESLIGKIVE